MSKARGLERRLERLVDGIASRVFRGRVHPVELGSRLIREADLAAIEGPAGPTIPNVFVIAADIEAPEQAALDEMKRELAAVLEDTAVEQGWRLDGPVIVAIGVGDGKGSDVTVQTGFETGDLPAWGMLMGTGDRTRLPLCHNRIVIGRGRESDLQISEEAISRRHALLWREGGRHWIADFQSANGTFVNGEPVAEVVEVVPADLISFAASSFVFRLGVVPDAAIAALTVLIVALFYLFLWQIARAIRVHLAPASSGLPTARLTITAPESVAGRVVVVDRPIVAGRSADADLPLDDAYCSDLHARFSLESGRLTVLDLGSTNGTFLNDHRIEGPAAPGPGDAVRLGGTIMVVQ